MGRSAYPTKDGAAAPYDDPALGEERRQAGDRAAAAFVIALVAMATGVAARDITAPTRRRAAAARARQIAMYLTHVGFEWPLARVGAAFGRDRTTAGHACHRIEDLRDDAGFDARISALEACLRTAPHREAGALAAHANEIVASEVAAWEGARGGGGRWA